MAHGEGTPPVSDTPASDPAVIIDGAGYTGVDRRKTDPLQIAIESAVNKVQTTNSKSWLEVNVLRDLVIRGTAIALILIVLLYQLVLARNQHDAEANQKVFRDTVTCFIVQISTTPVADRNDILTKCNLLKAPTKR